MASIKGTSDNDVIYASNLEGTTADENTPTRIYGGGGNDFISGDTDTDTAIFGGQGSDWLEGNDGDNLGGGRGNDVLVSLGSKTLNGGQGHDVLHVAGDLGDGAKLSGGDGDDYLSGNHNDQFFTGGSGADTYHFGSSILDSDPKYDSTSPTTHSGHDRIVDFEIGVDTISIDPAIHTHFDELDIKQVGPTTVITLSTGATITLNNTTATALSADNFVFQGGQEYQSKLGIWGDDTGEPVEEPQYITGGGGDDHIVLDTATGDTAVGGRGSDLIEGFGNDNLGGGSGDDVLISRGENDKLLGGSGNDVLQISGDVASNGRLYGNDGDDFLSGNEGDQFFVGGAGADIYHFGSSILGDSTTNDSGDDRIVDFDAGVDTISIDSAIHTSFDELDIQKVGSTTVITLSTGSTITLNKTTPSALSEENFVFQSADAYVEKLGIWKEQLVNSGENNLPVNENDVLLGGDENDVLNGGKGDDYLSGGLGTDVLTGGEGSDVFGVSIGQSSERYYYSPASDGHNYVTRYNGFDHDDIDHDVITDFEPGVDKIRVFYTGESFNVGDVTYVQQLDDLKITLNDNVSITLENTNEEDINPEDFEFFLKTKSSIGGDGNDVLVNQDKTEGTMYGGAGEDIFSFGDAYSQINGQSLRSEYFFDFDYGHGHDLEHYIVEDFTLNEDLIQIWTTIDFDRLDIAQVGSDTLITRPYTNSITLKNVDAATLSESDFIINGQAYTNNQGYLVGDDTDNQIVSGKGAITIFGYEGNDQLFGNEGNQSIHGGVGNDTVYGLKGDDFIDGESGDDILDGGEGDDRIWGGGGNDTVYGLKGDDFIYGEFGDDILDGGEGDDTILGGSGSDQLFGGGGDDYISASEGNNLAYGGDGDDIIVNGLSFSDSVNTLYGGKGNDILKVSNWSDANAHETTLFGGEGNDTFDIELFDSVRRPKDKEINIEDFDVDNEKLIISFSGSDDYGVDFNNGNTYYNLSDKSIVTLKGVSQEDLNLENISISLDLSNTSPHDISIDNASFTVSGGIYSDAIVTGKGNDIVSTHKGDDSISTGSGNDQLFGGSGDDILKAGVGDDVLDGGVGNDTLDGGDGADTLISGRGNDNLRGGEGKDTFVFDWSDGIDRVEDFEVGMDRLNVTLKSSSNIAKNFKDTYLVEQGSDTLLNLYGNINNHTVLFENADLMAISLEDIDFNLIGETGEYNVLIGGAGNDTLQGVGRINWLDGGQGDDTYISSGQTVFFFGSGLLQGETFGHDSIHGFDDSGVINISDFSSLYSFNDLEIMQAGENTVITLPTSGTLSSSITLHDYNASNLSAAQFQFHVGDDGFGRHLVGNNGNNTLEGTDNRDLIESGNGDDVISGGAGEDVFSINGSFGHNVIEDFDPMQDVLEIVYKPNDGVETDIQLSVIDGSTIISLSEEKSITLNNVALTSLTDDNVNIIIQKDSDSEGVFSGSALSEVYRLDNAGDETLNAGGGDDVIYTGSGEYEIYAGDGEDTIYAGTGTETIHGGEGDDTFVLNVSQSSSLNAHVLFGGAGEDTFIFEEETSARYAEVPFIIEDFEVGIDVIHFDVLQTNVSFDDLQIFKPSPEPYTYIKLADYDFTIALKNVFVGAVDPDDFLFS
ncbi:calcium-binding protein [Enterovibrio norvegicus]|uniref:calcium-binding protein n=2 Tax=Enterovibrio norvegicus TaxID=188144 RepID=UPI000CB28A4F|nr:hypothetical protein [Enterovibrio norvegicus]PMN72449.1 hypothetical protein BCT27_13680 [Enterovibrio norvegicus]